METIETLVLAVRNGNQAAFGELVERFRANAHARAYRVLGDHHRAEDVVQEAFAEAYQCLDNLREPAAFPGWFKRIVIKQIDRVTRVRRRDTVELENAPEGSVEPEPVPDGSPEVFERALRALPEHEREVARLYYLEGRAQKDISESMGVPVGTIKKRLFTARQRLRDRLAEFDPQFSPDRAIDSPRDRLLAAVTGGYRSKVAELVQAIPSLAHARNDDGLDVLLAAIDASFRLRDYTVPEFLLLYRDQPGPHAAAGMGRDASVVSDLDARDGWGRTPLHWAAAGGHTAVVEALLARGANLRAADRWGCRPIHLAAEHGHLDVVELLLDAGADPAATLKNGKSVLHLAAHSGDLNLVERLMRRGATFDVFAAARLGHANVLSEMLRRNRRLVQNRLPYGATPLHVAAEARNEAAARLLIDAGADLDVVAAAELGWIDELEGLLARQPNAVNAQGGSFGFTALHAASTRGDRETARLLLAKGAQANAVDRMYRKTPLSEAIYFGKEAMARLLAVHGATV